MLESHSTERGCYGPQGKTVWEQAKEMGYQTVENDPAAIAMIVKTAKISR